MHTLWTCDLLSLNIHLGRAVQRRCQVLRDARCWKQKGNVSQWALSNYAQLSSRILKSSVRMYPFLTMCCCSACCCTGSRWQQHGWCTPHRSAGHPRCSWWCWWCTCGRGRPLQPRTLRRNLLRRCWPSWPSQGCSRSGRNSARVGGCRDPFSAVQEGWLSSHIDCPELWRWRWTTVHRANPAPPSSRWFEMRWDIRGLPWLRLCRWVPPPQQTNPTSGSHCHMTQPLRGQWADRALEHRSGTHKRRFVFWGVIHSNCVYLVDEYSLV